MPDRLVVVELRRELDAGEAPPDAAGEIADAVSALRLTTMAAVAAGPVMFETLDGRPFGIQPVLPIAATQPPGEPSRLDAFRTPIAVDVLAALGDADGDPELAEALDRWELSLFQSEPFRSEQIRVALASLLGETWPMRGCVLLAEDASAREELYGELTALSAGDAATAATTDAARRAVVAVLRSHDRERLAHDLDRELLGLDRRQAPRAIASDAVSARIRYPAGARRGLPSTRGRIAGRARATGADRGAGSAWGQAGGARRRAPSPPRGGRGVVATGGR